MLKKSEQTFARYPEPDKKLEKQKSIPDTLTAMYRNPEWSIVLKKAIRSGILRFPVCVLTLSIICLVGEYFVMQETFKMPTSLSDIHPFVIFWISLASLIICANLTSHFIEKYALEAGLADRDELRSVFGNNVSHDTTTKKTHFPDIESRSVNPSTGLPMVGGGVDVSGHSRGSS